MSAAAMATNMQRWGDHTVMRFVSLYQRLECLWNTFDPTYRNKECRLAALEKLVEGMAIPGFNVVDAKSKINNLRSSYLQELKKIEFSQQRGERLYVPTVVWFGKIDSFLRPHITRRISSNIQADATGRGSGSLGAPSPLSRDAWDTDVEDSMMGPPVPILELEHIKEEPPDLPSTSSSASPPRRFFRNTPREQEQPPWPRRQVPQQMPGVSGGSGGGGSMGAGGSQGPKQPSAQHISSMMKKHMSPGTPQQHSANKGAGPPRRVVSPPPSQSSHVGPPEVCLRWNSYHSNMQATFPSLLTNEQFVDVTLACEGRSIKCHKVILSACSAYFEGLLGENPCQHPIVLMKDLRYWEVQALVDFMYRGEVNVAQDKLPSLLAAAEALQIKGLAGPASTSSSQDEDSLPATLPSSLEEFLDDRAPSPITERRMRKRRMMNASELPHQLVRPQQMQHSQQQSQQQQLHHQQHQLQNRHQQMPPQPRPRPPLQAQQHPQMQRHMPSAAPSSSAAPVRVVRQQQQQHIPPRAPVTSVASTSSYRHEQAPEVPPPRKQRRSEPLPPVKIEPIDIDLSNDSMDEDFMEKKFTPPTESKDDGQPDSLLESVSEEQKPDIDSENFSETAVSSIRELQDFPFEPGSNSGGTKTESNAEATNDSPFDSSPGDDDGAGSHEEQAQD